MPTVAQPSMRQRIASSGHTSHVTAANPTSDSAADYHSPVYSAYMILCPGWFFTSEQPTMDAMMDKSVATERFRAVLVGTFAGLGLVLAMLGVYGIVAYTMAQRRFEFGVRMAFGAERSSILRSVLGYTMRRACLGIAIGIVVSAAMARVVESMLAGVRPVDPLSFGAVAGLLLMMALGAALLPGFVATRVSPMDALRAE